MYKKVFKEIVDVMRNDYAGCIDKKGWDHPERYTNQINEQTNRKDFVQLVKDYLLDYHDKHLFFLDKAKSSNKAVTSLGFSVRRYQDRLYVTRVDGVCELKVGMYFSTLGEQTILEARELYERQLSENHPERENWESVLANYTYGKIINKEGDTFVYQLKKMMIETTYQSIYSITELDNAIALITLTDFMQPDKIIEIVKENQTILNRSSKWIFDVRVNNGGSTAGFEPFLKPIMPIEGVTVNPIENEMTINYTEASARRQLPLLEKGLQEAEDERVKSFIQRFKQSWELNRGKGFVLFDSGSSNSFSGSQHPQSIVVLTDVYCGSSGDAFVEYCKLSSKVTVIGRATMGLNDYANLTVAAWDHLELWYPTSRLARIDRGKGMTKKGIEPDIYIPWTPAHLDYDVDMNKALGY
ncbi:TSPc, tail specific protease [Bacillus sp. JCM 19046]|nr:TSPc, tail specific protease [Bacillus sp. JCM 19046]